MRNWFETLQPREQVSVLVATVFVAVAVIYFGLWMPLSSSRAGLSQSIVTWESSLAELRSLKSAVQTGGSSTRPVPTGQSLVVVVDSTLSSFNLSASLRRSQPTGQNGIRVEFEDAAFDDLVRWLGQLSAQHGMQVQSGNFSASSQGIAGRVNASLNLER